MHFEPVDRFPLPSPLAILTTCRITPSFPQFKYLARLLLLHGRAAYKRNIEVVWYSFYKNWIYNMVLMFFGFVTGARGPQACRRRTPPAQSRVLCRCRLRRCRTTAADLLHTQRAASPAITLVPSPGCSHYRRSMPGRSLALCRLLLRSSPAFIKSSPPSPLSHPRRLLLAAAVHVRPHRLLQRVLHIRPHCGLRGAGAGPVRGA